MNDVCYKVVQKIDGKLLPVVCKHIKQYAVEYNIGEVTTAKNGSKLFAFFSQHQAIDWMTRMIYAVYSDNHSLHMISCDCSKHEPAPVKIPNPYIVSQNSVFAFWRGNLCIDLLSWPTPEGSILVDWIKPTRIICSMKRGDFA